MSVFNGYVFLLSDTVPGVCFLCGGMDARRLRVPSHKSASSPPR